MAETRTVHDPFFGKDVQISDRLVDRLRGRYASGPHLPNGNPEFGWRQFQAPPIQHEAAAVIEGLDLVRGTFLGYLQAENGCKRTGAACREKCGCELELQELVNAWGGVVSTQKEPS